MAEGADAAAKIDTEGLNVIDRFADIAGMQAASEENGHRGLFDDLAAQATVLPGIVAVSL